MSSQVPLDDDLKKSSDQIFREKYPDSMSPEEFRRQAEMRKGWKQYIPKAIRKKFKTFNNNLAFFSSLLLFNFVITTTTGAALCLLIFGLIFIITGIADISYGEQNRGISFLVIGVISLIPGAYFSFIFIRSLLNPVTQIGDHHEHIPSYDDEF